MGRTAKKAADETKSVDKSSKPSRNEIADRLQRKVVSASQWSMVNCRGSQDIFN